MKYRSRNHIISEILDAASGGGATKSKLMYTAFLNNKLLKKYLMPLLTENNLLSFDEQTRTFKTTEKGLRFLDKYHLIEVMIKEEEEKKN